MKKMASVVLACVLVTSLAGCGGGANDSLLNVELLGITIDPISNKPFIRVKDNPSAIGVGGFIGEYRVVGINKEDNTMTLVGANGKEFVVNAETGESVNNK